MACRYCFYKDLIKNRTEEKECFVMNSETQKELIKKCLEYSKKDEVTFFFQGGEPLLAGYDFFLHFIECVNKINNNNISVKYSIQTNGILLDEKFCALFKKHNFLVGISLDGIESVHNKLRSCNTNEGCFSQVTEKINLLKEYKIPYNILIVVTSLLAKHFSDVWSFLRKEKYDYLQFINYIAPFGQNELDLEYALTNDEFVQFNKVLFDAYLKENKAGKFVSVRHLDNILYALKGLQIEQCTMLGYCPGQLVVEQDGSVYPCDFYCTENYLLGNINTNSLKELEQSPAMKRFIEESCIIENKCRSCDVRGICRGGCRRERDFYGNGNLRLNRYCKGLHTFYRYILDTLQIK